MRKKYQNPLLSAAIIAMAAPRPIAAPGLNLWLLWLPSLLANCTGTVVDNTGEAMIGATVRAANDPKIASMTNVDGQFTLKNVKPGTTIVVSYIGY